MKMPPTHIMENKNSSLLTMDENQQVFDLLGSQCMVSKLKHKAAFRRLYILYFQALVTCVIQLYHTQPPSHLQWIKKDTGVLCFVKDNARKNYFFRLYCLKRNNLIWEHEVYNDMDYIVSTEFLHTFEGEVIET